MDFELIRFQAHELDVWQRHLAILMVDQPGVGEVRQAQHIVSYRGREWGPSVKDSVVCQ